MRYLLLLFVIPFLSVEAAGPDCSKLKGIAAHLEKLIQGAPKDFHKECEKMTPESLGLPADSIGFSGEWDYRCKNLSAIDAQLKSIENEIALLKGIESLKSEIIDGIATIKKFDNPNQVKEASVSFVNNLNVATSLELFMATNNTKSENILSKIVADKVGWTDINSFDGLRKKHCKDFGSAKGTVCDQGFALSEETFKEINDFVTVGKTTERKFNKHQIKDLKKALEITKHKEGSGIEVGVYYSFGQIASELKGIQPDGLLAPDDMEVIKALPKLSNNTSYDFLKNINASIKTINSSEDLLKAQGISSRFSSLLNDLRKRQEWEMKTKISLALHQHQDAIGDAKDKCDQARELIKESVPACLTALSTSKGLLPNEQAAIRDLITEMDYSQKQVARLDDQIANCVPDETTLTFTDTTKCDGILTLNMADLVSKSLVLNALKAKHIQARPDLITFRNFALEKLHSGKCVTAGESNITCAADLGNISLEAITLTGDAADIIYVFDKPKEDTILDQLCLDSKEEIPFKADLCALKDDEPTKKTTKDDNYEAPVSPDDNGAFNKALVDLGLNAVNSIANIFAPPPPQNYNVGNQYGPQPFPYVMPNQPQHISNRIMDPYVASSFGNYSTNGAIPYSSNGGGGMPVPYVSGGGSHTNSPTGW
jgi:hypothetical protein